MELREDDHGWELKLTDGRVALLEIDFRVGLLLSAGSDHVRIHIETPFRLRGPDLDATLVPGECSTLAPILAFFNNGVIDLLVRRTGVLTVHFEGDRTIEVQPHPSCEAWQVGSSIGFLLVCAPGGKVALFSRPVHRTAEGG